jgi:DNA repair exonuclease SbcCD ATPase subunit
MNELNATNSMTALANIERRINYHIQGAYANIVEVGRCLIEAKETGVVPHGQFEEWAERVTGLKKRNYQRLMQVAREVSPDSAMAKLPITKITAILSLPEPQREEVAERAVEENQSLRELQATIDAMKEELDATRKQANRTAQERDNAIAVLDKAQKRRAEFEHECNALRRQVQEAKEAPATGISAEARKRIDQLRGELKAEQRKVEILYTETQTLGTQKDALREMLAEAREAQATGISDEAQAEIDRLTAQLADAEKMAEYQAEQRQQAQRELMDLKTQAARGDVAPVEDLTAESVGLAVRTFITSVGYLPHSDKLTAMRYQDRQQVQAFARMIGKWAADVQNTLDNVNDAIVIMEG